jgi:hypothetical protein
MPSSAERVRIAHTSGDVVVTSVGLRQGYSARRNMNWRRQARSVQGSEECANESGNWTAVWNLIPMAGALC